MQKGVVDARTKNTRAVDRDGIGCRGHRARARLAAGTLD
jgi:hypothetical protein